jgi:replication initiation and membrane attachment protein
MKIITGQDLIQLHLETLISDQDVVVLTEFYGPLIGLEALGLYLSIKQQEGLLESEPITLANWLMLTQASPNQFHQARIQLEALGLLRTYEQILQQTHVFIMSLYAPKSPQAFLQDPILSGLLTQTIGPVALARLKTKYQFTLLPTGLKEVTTAFGEVFHPDLHHPAFVLNKHATIKGKTLAEIRQPFDRLQLSEQLKQQFSIDMGKLNSQDIDDVIAVATLVGLDELALADLIGTHLDMQHRIMIPKLIDAARTEKRLPFIRQRQQQKIQLSETSDQTVLINQMEMMPPLEFLSLKQHGADVAPADLSLLMKLQSQYQLANPVINALIHQVLATQNNVLSSRYVEKLAAALKRENVQHAIDTMDFFYKVSQPKSSIPKPSSSKEPEVNETKTPPLPIAKAPSMPVDDHEIADLEAKLKGLK